MARDNHIPKCRVDDWRKDFYEDAWVKHAKDDPDFSFSDWVRRACDNQAKRDLGLEAVPVPPRER